VPPDAAGHLGEFYLGQDIAGRHAL